MWYHSNMPIRLKCIRHSDEMFLLRIICFCKRQVKEECNQTDRRNQNHFLPHSNLYHSSKQCFCNKCRLHFQIFRLHIVCCDEHIMHLLQKIHQLKYLRQLVAIECLLPILLFLKHCTRLMKYNMFSTEKMLHLYIMYHYIHRWHLYQH